MTEGIGIELRVVDPPIKDGHIDNWGAEPGMMWHCPSAGRSHDIPGRGPCWVIRLPNGGYVFHTNMESSDGGFWTVTGEPPNITVQPSINVGPDIWHGHITDGKFTA